MRTAFLTLTMMLLATPAFADGESLVVQTPIARFVIVDVIRRTNSTLIAVMDRETGAIEYKTVRIPRRRITIDKRTWDPIAGKYREIIGYDGLNLPVYRDEGDPGRVVYWVTEKSQFPMARAIERVPQPPPDPAPAPCPVPCCRGRVK